MKTNKKMDFSYCGKQTKEALANFNIGTQTFSVDFIKSLALVKKCSFIVNIRLNELDSLNNKAKKAVIEACNEVIEGKLADEFPVSVWQSGSGTQTNMNVNEVIANRANEILGKKEVHPNDHVNRAQSTNDVFPTAMHVVMVNKIIHNLIPALEKLQNVFDKKSKKWADIIKIGRTHMQDAVPISVGQELSTYSQQLKNCNYELTKVLRELYYIPIGGTAVGTGLNSKKEYDVLVTKCLSHETELPFKVAKNKSVLMAAHDDFVSASSALKRIAITLTKIANDIRFLSSGPNSGIGEFKIPQNELGSSIMPGKANPTQCESLTMVCARVIGNDLTITFAASQGHLQLNAYKPVIIYSILESINLLTDGINSFKTKCIEGLEIDKEKIKKNVDNSLMLVTALNNHIGYDNATKVAQKAYEEKITLCEAAVSFNFLTKEEFKEIVDPNRMIAKL